MKKMVRNAGRLGKISLMILLIALFVFAQAGLQALADDESTEPADEQQTEPAEDGTPEDGTEKTEQTEEIQPAEVSESTEENSENTAEGAAETENSAENTEGASTDGNEVSTVPDGEEETQQDEETAEESPAEEPIDDGEEFQASLDGSGTDSYSVTVTWEIENIDANLASADYTWDAVNCRYTASGVTDGDGNRLFSGGSSTAEADVKITVTDSSTEAGVSWSYTVSKTDTDLSDAGYEIGHTGDFSGEYISAADEPWTDTVSLSATCAEPAELEELSICEYRVTIGDMRYTNTCGNILSVNVLKASRGISYTVDGLTVCAYNGFISCTGGSSWYDAVAFIRMLNTAGVSPDGDPGSWRLLSTESDSQAWYAASGSPACYEPVYALWSSAEETIGESAWRLDIGVNSWNSEEEGAGYEDYGFVPIWVPAVIG